MYIDCKTKLISLFPQGESDPDDGKIICEIYLTILLFWNNQSRALPLTQQR